MKCVGIGVKTVVSSRQSSGFYIVTTVLENRDGLVTSVNPEAPTMKPNIDRALRRS